MRAHSDIPSYLEPRGPFGHPAGKKISRPGNPAEYCFDSIMLLINLIGTAMLSTR